MAMQETHTTTVDNLFAASQIMPLVACIVAVCWGMDSFNTTKIIAVVLIFGGVYLVTSSRTREPCSR